VIISHKHKFIFIHCRKVAGSSIETYLSNYLGPDDLMIGSWGDAIRSGIRPNRRLVREMASAQGVKHITTEFLNRVRNRKLPNGNMINLAHQKLYSSHLGGNATFPDAAVLKAWAPFEWENYFKFCFVRNSYARAVSDWKWRTRHLKGTPVPFLEFLTRVADPSVPDPEEVVPSPRTNWPLYTISDEIAVDYVGRMETLASGMQHVCGVIGIPFSADALPHAKKQSNVGTNYRSFYSAPEIETAYSAYRKEIDQFGFQF